MIAVVSGRRRAGSTSLSSASSSSSLSSLLFHSFVVVVVLLLLLFVVENGGCSFFASALPFVSSSSSSNVANTGGGRSSGSNGNKVVETSTDVVVEDDTSILVDGAGFALDGIEQDVFVHAAPLILAVVCSDGVLIIAAHTHDDQEPLLYLTPSDNDDDDDEDGDQEDQDNDDNYFLDLPEHYRGPYRIHVLDNTYTNNVLACTGWRADCETLASYARELSIQEINRYGPPSCSKSHSSLISKQLSHIMAECSVSQRIRTFSCAGMLISPSLSAASSSKAKPGGGYVWLIDSCGAFRVRALCIGGGSILTPTPENKGSSSSVSDIVNRKLMDTDFSNTNTDDALQFLLKFLSTGGNDNNNEDAPSSKSSSSSSLLRKGTRLEIVIVGGGDGDGSNKSRSKANITRRNCRKKKD